MKGRSSLDISETYDREEIITVNSTEDEDNHDLMMLKKEKDDLEYHNRHLKKSLDALKSQHEALEKKRKEEDKEIVSTMQMMKDYIEKLERENDDLATAYKAQHHELQETKKARSWSLKSTIAAQPKAASETEQKEFIAMAAKLAKEEKQNGILKDTIILQRKRLEIKAKENERLQEKLDEALDERERIAIKCLSLEQVVHTLVNETSPAMPTDSSHDQSPPPEQPEQSVADQESMHEGSQGGMENNGGTIAEKPRQSQTCDGEDSIDNTIDDLDNHVEVEAVDSLARPLDAILVETVSEDSDVEADSSSSNRNVSIEAVDEKKEENVLHTSGPSTLDQSIEDISDGDSTSTKSEEDEERDHLGPLPSNPFSTLDKTVPIGTDTDSPTFQVEDINAYLQELVLAQQQEESESKEELSTQEKSSSDGVLVDASPDARLEIYGTLSDRNPGWKDRLLKLRPFDRKSVGSTQVEGDPKSETKDGVWC